MQPIRVGLLGLGVVGSGVVNVLNRNANEIARRAGREVCVTAALVRDIHKKRGCDISGLELVTDPLQIIQNPDIDVVVELMGGTAAKEWVSLAIQSGKPVVTANKALIAQEGNALFSEADDASVPIAYEAAVAGGIPVIKALKESLSANHIHWVAGIINGTANYILSEMTETGVSFSEALADAKERGYAEADPSLDIEGIDAAHKLTILASLAFGLPLSFEHVYTEGITHITSADVAYARELGYKIKHLGIAKRTAEGIELRVHPTLIPDNCLLSSVSGANNAVLVQSDAVGPTIYYGAGAGSEPTASAVIADIIDVTRTKQPFTPAVPHLAFHKDLLIQYPMMPMDAVETACYLRCHVIDRPGVLADITRALGDAGISIQSIIQKGAVIGDDYVPIIIETHPVLEGNVNDAIEQIANVDGVHGDVVRIRIDKLDSLENSL